MIVAESGREVPLMMSQAHCAGLPGKRLIPDRNGMIGLARDAVADLFLQHCPGVRDGRDAATHRRGAMQVALETEGLLDCHTVAGCCL